MFDETSTVGLHTRGPLSWYGTSEEYVWDFDDNMRKIDTEFQQMQQAITALGGNVGGTLNLDSGTF